MCCGRGEWHLEFDSEDERDAYISTIEDENRRWLVRTRWLEDRLGQMNEDLERARADLSRAQTDLARAQRAPPRHATGLSSLMQARRPVPADESVITPCAWHDEADHGYHNVADLSCVVGEYNQVLD